MFATWSGSNARVAPSEGDTPLSPGTSPLRNQAIGPGREQVAEPARPTPGSSEDISAGTRATPRRKNGSAHYLVATAVATIS